MCGWVGRCVCVHGYVCVCVGVCTCVCVCAYVHACMCFSKKRVYTSAYIYMGR